MNCLLHAIATRSQPPAACPPTCPPAHPSALPRRVAELEGFIRRHQEHVTRLEQVLRLLSNDEVTPEEVEGLKEGMQYYLESSTEPGFEPDETLYDTLPLSDVSPPPPELHRPLGPPVAAAVVVQSVGGQGAAGVLSCCGLPAHLPPACHVRPQVDENIGKITTHMPRAKSGVFGLLASYPLFGTTAAPHKVAFSALPAGLLPCGFPVPLMQKRQRLRLPSSSCPRGAPRAQSVPRAAPRPGGRPRVRHCFGNGVAALVLSTVRACIVLTPFACPLQWRRPAAKRVESKVPWPRHQACRLRLLPLPFLPQQQRRRRLRRQRRLAVHPFLLSRRRQQQQEQEPQPAAGPPAGPTLPTKGHR